MIVYFVYRILSMVIEAYMLLIGIYALMSWFPGAYQTGLGRIVRYFVEPLLKPFRKLNLRLGVVDFTVFVAFIALNFARYLLLQLVALIFTIW